MTWPAPADWSHEGIDYCVRRSLMVGTGVGTFSPNAVCSRAQIVQILYNLSGDTTDYGNYYLPFTDVAPGDWFYEAVAWPTPTTSSPARARPRSPRTLTSPASR